MIGTLNSLENNLLKIVSCGNIDIEIAVKGTIMVSAGHFYMVIFSNNEKRKCVFVLTVFGC